MVTLHKPFIVLSAVLLFGFLLGTSPGSIQDRQQTSGTRFADRPIALEGDAIGDLLRKWFSQGTAAGNIGDYYDNRDGGHSQLDLKPYPQLRQIEYTDAQIKARQNWGLQGSLLPYVVFGNSSTSAPPEEGGSNPRRYYTDPRGLEFLFAQYARNNLYIYPEHRDHDPGHNGIEGYGDLFPTNTPYLIISQGSSGTDQPFMRSIPQVLAAFRPEVKQKLIRTGLLMPTIQMLMRFTNRQLANSSEYLTGKAHPTVFEGKDINPKKMVELAHEITLATLPPMALIKVIKEDTPVNGVDYFEPEHTEKLADTPAVVARVFRGSGSHRKITLSAEESKDLNGRPLKYFWSVLRGDTSRIKIEYRNLSHSIAELSIPYPDRLPVAGQAALQSNRVDIGVFVHNGVYYSPPAFLTLYSLDSEARTYDPGGRLLDIGYGAGSATIAVSDWSALFGAVTDKNIPLSTSLLRSQFSTEEMAEIRSAAERFLTAQAAVPKAIDPKEKPPKEYAAASTLMQRALNSLLNNPDLWTANSDALERIYQTAREEDRKALDSVRQSLRLFGIAEESANHALSWNPLRKGDTPLAQRLTRYEKSMIEHFNAIVLERLIFPGMITGNWRSNYVDSRLAAFKEWRDVYRYAPDGTLLGWTRYQPDGVRKFNAEGFLVLEEDARGRCLKAQRVRYEIPLKTSKSDSPSSGAVVIIPTEELREYKYSSAKE